MDERLRTIECLIAPTQTGGIYYTGPSEDFERPGRMWWSVPDGIDDFHPWREVTTVYHEGVPGHHLQVAQTVFRSELLNSWRRMAAWVSSTPTPGPSDSRCTRASWWDGRCRSRAWNGCCA